MRNVGSTLATTVLTSHTIRLDDSRIAKFGKSLEPAIYQKIMSQTTRLKELTVNSLEHGVYYQEACRYWLKACIGLPHFKRNGKSIAPPHGRFTYLKSAKAAEFVGCLLNSSLFYWYYSVLSDCEHVNDELVKDFPIPECWPNQPWSKLALQLFESLEKYATRKVIRTKQGHTIEYDEIKATFSKDVINKIDIALSESYDLTRDEVDFIINYDIKYRMGQDEASDE